MQAALLLISRYSAVGTLEHLPAFWATLSARTRLKMTHQQVESASTHAINTAGKPKGDSTDPDKVAAKEAEIVLVKARLQQWLGCDVLLWQVAEMISKHDEIYLLVREEAKWREWSSSSSSSSFLSTSRRTAITSADAGTSGSRRGSSSGSSGNTPPFQPSPEASALETQLRAREQAYLQALEADIVELDRQEEIAMLQREKEEEE